MEDVIFAGSQSRQPVGMAEVNLKVSGLNGNSPDGNPECVVTRRLYRNGESEYLMNGQVCRLRDIHELFMDTGPRQQGVLDHRAGQDRPDPLRQARRPPRAHRGGRGHHEVQGAPAADPAQARGRAAEPPPRERHRPRGREAAREPEAPGQQGAPLPRRARGDAGRRARPVRPPLRRPARAGARRCPRASAREGEREQAATIALETEEAQMEVRRTVLYEDEARSQDVRDAARTS